MFIKERKWEGGNFRGVTEEEKGGVRILCVCVLASVICFIRLISNCPSQKQGFRLNVSGCLSAVLIHLLFKYFIAFQVTQLKIDYNPFAKGFRDTGNGRREKR